MRFLGLVIGVSFFGLGHPLAAGETPPAILVRAQSLDALTGQGKVLFDQLGLGKTATQLQTLLKTKAGPKGFEGIDPARPLGLFVSFNPDPAGALLLPITGEQAFLDLLDRLDLKTAKEADGIYTIRVGVPIPVYLKFASKHAWITVLNKSVWAGKPADAGQILGTGGPLFSARTRIDLLPNDARQLAISSIEDKLQQALKKNPPNETPAQKAFAEACNQTLARLFAQVLQEGKELSLDVDLNAAQKELTAQLTLTPKADTPLAKSIAQGGKLSSPLPASAPADSALFARLNIALPDQIAQALSQVFEEGFQDSLANLRDAGKKKQAQDLLDALRPSLKAGEIDALLRLVGPSGDQKLGAIVAIRTKDADRLGTLFRTLADEAKKQMPEAEQAKVQLDADAAGAIKIHRFQLSAENASVKKAKDILGDPTLSLAFRPDAVVAGLGSDSLPALKTLIEAKGAANTPLMVIQLDAARLGSLLAPTPKLRAAARTLFNQPDDGLIRLRADGGTNLRLSLSVRTPVLQFLGQTREEPAAPVEEK